MCVYYIHLSKRVLLCTEKFTVFIFICRDEDVNELGYVTLDITSFGHTTKTIWINSNLTCTRNEVCLTKCLPSVFSISPLSQCSSQVAVRCSKYH